MMFKMRHSLKRFSSSS